MAWGKSLTADAQAPTQDAPLQHAVSPFPFDATLHIPLLPTQAEVVRAAELAAQPVEVTLAEQTLIEICGNKFMSESVRVRASQLILERYDQKTLIAQLQAEIDELKAMKTAQTDDGELPPALRRGR